MNDSKGSWNWPSVENRTGCELGLMKLMRKKYFELHGINSTSTLDEYHVKINKTDVITIIDDFINDCSFDENKNAFLKKTTYYVSHVAIPSYLGVGAIANFLVIIFFLQMYKKKISKMSSYHFLIVNLAIADLLVCVLVPVTLSKRLNESLQTFGRFECHFLWPFTSSVCPSASCWFLVLLAFARYRRIMKPLQTKLKKKICCIFIFIIWLISFAVSSYWFSSLGYSDTRGCFIELSVKQGLIYRASLFVFYSIMPIILMWYFFSKIEKKLTENETDRNLVLSELSRQRNRKALKTLRILLAIFVITVFPGQILFIVSAYAIKFMHVDGLMIGYWLWIPYMHAVNLLSVVLFFANNVLNVFVYLKMFPDFRRFLLKIFTFGRCGKNEQ